MRRFALAVVTLLVSACTSSGSTTTTSPVPPGSKPPPLSARVQIHPADVLWYISINVAQPPFDDIHVRKAVEYAISKAAMRKLRTGPIAEQIATHVFPDSLENNALLHYDPYRTPSERGSIARAKAEMRLSKYDHNRDGVCDDPARQDVLTPIDPDSYVEQVELLARNLRPIGITLHTLSGECCSRVALARCLDPTAHSGLCPSFGWGKDYADGFSFAGPLFASASIGPVGCCNYSMVGASPSLLRKARYTTTHVPSVDARINHCQALLGAARSTCWAALDRYLMEKVVPIVPLEFDNTVNVLSARTSCYSFDQFTGEVALDHLCVVGVKASN